MVHLFLLPAVPERCGRQAHACSSSSQKYSFLWKFSSSFHILNTKSKATIQHLLQFVLYSLCCARKINCKKNPLHSILMLCYCNYCCGHQIQPKRSRVTSKCHFDSISNINGAPQVAPELVFQMSKIFSRAFTSFRP